MPVLGSDSDDNNFSRRQATAYAGAQRSGSAGWMSVVGLFLALLILKNILFTDYRHEAVATLTEAGRPASEIERFVPKTPQERAQYVKDKSIGYEELKQDVAYLLSEVHELKKILNTTTTINPNPPMLRGGGGDREAD